MEKKKISIWLFALIFFSSIHFVHLARNISHVKLKLNKAFNSYSINLDRQSFQLGSSENETEIMNTSLQSYCDSHLKQPDCYSSTQSLDFSEINFLKIPVNLINKWFGSELRQLNVSHNLIGNLSLEFTSPHLESIDLSFNQIGCIEADSFRSLKSLKFLYLQNNQISSINSFAFSDVTRYLIELNLNNNLLTDNSIEFLLFASLTNLKYLHMNSNRLTTISHHLLSNLYSLEYLSLKENNLITFELFKLNKNNLLLKYLDLSLNRNLKFETENFESKYLNNELNDAAYSHQVTSDEANSFQLEILNLAETDLSTADSILDAIFDKYKSLKHLNMSQTKLKSFWSLKWPTSIETIDVSFNSIKDEQFDCRQLMSSEQLTNKELKLRQIYLNNNKLASFKKFIENCSPVLSKFSLLKIDLRYNSFTSIDSVYSSLSLIHKKTSFLSLSSISLEKKCIHSANRSSLVLYGNPLVCDCETNNWWANIGLSSFPKLFFVNNEFCLNIEDYDSLSCSSLSIQENNLTNFTPIRNYQIAPHLVCPYRYSCSSKTCQCCGFKACDCSFSCPAACKCTRDYANNFDKVDCHNVSMNLIPNYLPITTTDLLMENNNLKKIQPFQFFGRFRLLRIDLSFNQIAFIEESSFNGLSQLKSLNISHNNLQILLGYEFRDLSQLEQLHLEYNQIQFISNSTFSLLSQLKYLNLRNNMLRHSLDMFFQFNHNLVNLSIDYITTHEPVVYSNDLKNLITNSTKLNENENKDFYYYYSDYYDSSSNSNSNSELVQDFNDEKIKDTANEKQDFALQTENLVETLLNSDKLKMSRLAKQMLIDCILEKFKTFNDHRDNKEIVLIRNFKRFKTNCLKNSNLNEETEESASLSSTGLETEQNRIGLFKKENTKFSALHLANRPNQPFIVLNYNTILMGSILMFFIVIIFSALLAFLVIKLKRTKRSQIQLKDTAIHREYCHMSSFRYLSDVIRQKFNRLMGINPDVKSNYQQPIKKVRVYAHPQEIDEEDEETSKINYDIFIVYNKLDSDLVHNVIAPILKSKPYNFTVALQHCLYKTQSADTSITSSSLKTNSTTVIENFNSMTSSFYSLSCDSIQANDDLSGSLIKSSSLVLFVLSNHMLTDAEYNLSMRTPKNKKFVILADEINPEVAESILKPKKILRGQFDLDKMTFNFYCANASRLNEYEYDFLYEIRNSSKNRSSEHNSFSSVVFRKDNDGKGPRHVKI